MLQKILVILVGLAMSLVGALSPEGFFAAQDAGQDGLGLDVGLSARDETLATVRLADKAAFAKVPILWAEVEGRRVVEDAWGTGEVKELRFKVGVKGVEGTALLVGDRQVPLLPTDVLTVRMFQGDFSFRGVGTPQATLQLQGDVKTATLTKGESGNRLLTQAGETPAANEGRPADGRVAYVVLTTGQKLDTVALEQGGARLVTQEEDAGKAEPGNLLAKWVRINGKLIREYTWGEGQLDSVEFEAAAENGRDVLVAYDGDAAAVQTGVRVTVKDFVGEYLVYQVAGGQVRVRLDGYAGDYVEGTVAAPLPPTSSPLDGPVAAFDFSPANPRTTDTIRFRDTSVAPENGDIALRRWDFGDGSADVRRDPTHRYDKPGVYEVTLNVTDLDVRVAQVKRTITVRNAEPQPDFDFAPKRLYSGSLVSFTDLSRDADGAVLNWTWDFGDGEVSYSRNPVHRFARGGEHTVTLTVRDDLLGVSTLTKTVIVLNTAPTASFTFAPTQPGSQVPVQFFDDSRDADGSVVAWDWRFGDFGNATGPTPTFSFPKPGPVVVSLTVTDNAGGTTTTTQTLVIQNQPPRADFLWAPMGAPAHTPVEFRSASTDPDGLVLLVSWDFGDGSGPARDSPVTHVFPRAGTYDVTVTVTDNFLATSSMTRSVTIANAAPLADFSVAPNPTFRHVPVTFADLSRDPDGDPIAERTWDFGDGAPLLTTTDGTTSHAYDRLGSFSATLRVKDDKGNLAHVTRPVNVLNRIPTGAFTWEPAIPTANQPTWLNATGLDVDSAGPLTFRWQFSDGTTATGDFVQKTFLQAGPQTVVLRVHDSEGGVSIPIVRTFGVNLAPPVASFTFSPTVPTTEDSVTFTDTSSSLNGDIVARQWFVDQQGVTSDGNPFFFTFPEARTYMVSLRVTDEDGASEWYHHNVTVNGRPEAIFDTPVGQVPLNEAVTFTDRSHDPERRPMGYLWNFGDGSTSTQRGNVTHTYSEPGPKTVTLTVTDERGATDVETRLVNVLNRRPVARWEITTDDPRVGQEVQFVSTGHAFDPDGAGQIEGWAWNFGDGGTASSADPEHVFARSGLYTVNLQVTDGLLKSNVEPGSYRLVRIGADHPVTVTLIGKFPDGRDAPLLDNRFALTGSFGQLATCFREVRKTEFAPNGTALDLTLDPGEWLAGDQVLVGIRDTLFMDFPIEKIATLVETDGLSTSVKLLFEFPLPLKATVDVEAGEDALGFLPVNPFRNATETDGGEPIYRDPTQQFHGSGRVTFLDGVPVHRADVTLYARYVPTALVATAQDAADLDGIAGLGVLGWCRAASAQTDLQGTYNWTFSGADCLSTALSAYPLGRWEIRALATYRTATSAYSEPAGVWVDPTGGDLANLPLP